MPVLRENQSKLRDDVYQAWNAGHRNVLAVLPTGGGKTVIMGDMFVRLQAPGVAIAHRQELVSQISNSLASFGLYHRIIAPSPLIRFCITQHIKRFGRSYHHENAPIAVTGIDTINRRADDLVQWLPTVRMWSIDEAHHVLMSNKWGKGIQLFPNAWGVGFTATPTRADRRALGAHKSGAFHYMVKGPEMRELIRLGFLAPYRIFGPPASYTMEEDDISNSTGDYKPDKLRERAHNSGIVGDIVAHYLKIAPGKLGITFVPDVDLAIQVAGNYTSQGVPAAAVSANTPDHIRQDAVERLQRRELLQLVNVDLFGEGFDVPGVEVVSMGRKTMSLGLYRQQAGRALRPVYAPGFDLNSVDGRLAAMLAGSKPNGIIIDHVENVIQHGPPDRITAWTLDEPERKKKVKGDDEIPVKTCLNMECMADYEATHKACPYCGTRPEPASRSAPEFVDGDLTEYSPELLAKLAGEIADADSRPTFPYGATDAIAGALMKHHRERVGAHNDLRDAINMWAGISRDVYGRSDSESYRRFYWKFGIDVLTAQTLDRTKTEELTALIRSTYT